MHGYMDIWTMMYGGIPKEGGRGRMSERGVCVCARRN